MVSIFFKVPHSLAKTMFINFIFAKRGIQWKKGVLIIKLRVKLTCLCAYFGLYA